MSGVRLFRQAEQQLNAGVDGGATLGLVNVSFSPTLGGGIGTFEACDVPWTVTYDEILFVHEGELLIDVAASRYRVRAGDVIFIPAGTVLHYGAGEKVTYFYATCPAERSPSTGKRIAYPEAEPEPLAR